MDVTGHDRIPVEKDGEEIEVFNHVSVLQEHYVNSVNSYDTFHGPIKAGDGGIGVPDAVTTRVATMLYDEFSIDLENSDEYDIDVIDPSAEEVDVL